MRRLGLVAIAGGLAAIGMATFSIYLYQRPTLLRVAVIRDSEDQRLFAEAAKGFVRDKDTIRFRLVPVNDASATSAALEAGEADLAVVRSDIAMPPSGQSLLIMRRSAAVLLAPPGSPYTSVSDLSGKKVGVLRGAAQGVGGGNLRLLDTILAQYDIASNNVERISLSLTDVPAAIESKSVDAVMVVGVPSSGIVAETVASITLASGGTPVFIPIAEAKAIEQRSPSFESIEVVRGAFGGAPPKPPAAFETLGVSIRLVARASLKDAVAGDVTRLMLNAKSSLAARLPGANRIEAPPTDKDATLPVHPGAAAYIDGEEETFFDKYSDFLYLGAMLISVLGSGLAALASRMNSRQHAEMEALLARLLDIHKRVRAAASPEDVHSLEEEADEVMASALGQSSTQTLDGHRVNALSLALHQVRLAIDDRRKKVESSPTQPG